MSTTLIIAGAAGLALLGYRLAKLAKARRDPNAARSRENVRIADAFRREARKVEQQMDRLIRARDAARLGTPPTMRERGQA